MPKFAATGSPCEDGDKCTFGDNCFKVGVCLPGAPTSCLAQDDCHTAFCNKDTGACGQLPKADGATCSDGNACSSGEVCKIGTCSGGTLATCAGTACQDGVCNPASGKCDLAAKAEGTLCNQDKNLCTSDACNAKGECVLQKAVVCTAPVCNSLKCNPNSGICDQVPLLDGSACSDDNTCTDGDSCVSGVCLAAGYTCECKVDADCNDKNECTTNTCVTTAGKFTCLTSAIVGSPCDDGNACTAADACTAKGTCSGGTVVCNDNNPCTSDACDPASGCQTTALPGAVCDDGEPCTSGDVCGEGGICAGKVNSCDDVNPCTNDACASGACQHVANSAACSDSNACTSGDGCKDKACAPGGTKVDCDDQNPCNTDTCAPADGQCSHSATEGVACDDGSTCTSSDKCSSAGKCQGVGTVCDDGNLCTTDGCKNGSGSCSFDANTLPCSDSNPCTLSDTCAGTVCVAGAAKDCDDKNSCTTDSCSLGSGTCLYSASGSTSSCASGSLCNGSACLCTLFSTLGVKDAVYNSVAAISDGSIAVGYNPSVPAMVLAQKHDKFGNIVWTTTFAKLTGGSPTGVLNGVVAKGTSNVLGVGTCSLLDSGSTTLYHNHPMLVSVSSGGAIYIAAMGANGRMNDVAYNASDSALYTAGDTFSGSGTYSAQATRMSSFDANATVWSKLYSPGTFEAITSMNATSSVAAGWTGTYPGYKGLIVQFKDSDGSELLKLQISPPSGYGSSHFYGVAANNDMIVAVGGVVDTTTGKNRGWLYIYTMATGVASSNLIGPADDDQLQDVLINGNSAYYVGYTGNQESKQAQGWYGYYNLTEPAKSGYKTYGTSNIDRLFGLAMLNSSTMVLVGDTGPSSPKAGMILQTNFNGMAACQ